MRAHGNIFRLLVVGTTLSVSLSAQAAPPRSLNKGDQYASACWQFIFKSKDTVEITGSNRCTIFDPGITERKYKFEDGKVRLDAGGGAVMIIPFDENGCLNEPSKFGTMCKGRAFKP